MDSVKCPACGELIFFTFVDAEIKQGGKNVACQHPQCKKVLWISSSGEIKPLPLINDEDFSEQYQNSGC